MSGGESILGEWVHAHEEDDGPRRVFHRPDHEFGPARGRVRFALLENGEVAVSGPGPDDRPVSTAGSWTRSGDDLTIDADNWGGQFEIVSSNDDTMVLQVKG